MATAYTPHTCDADITQYRCEGTECGDNASGERYDGVCDKDGCDINPFRMGNPNFYGRGDQYTVNTLKPMTLVTQFITDDGTDSGDLVEIKRFYAQDGQIIHSPESKILGPAGYTDSDSITDQFCEDKKKLFSDVNDYQEKGGNKGMGDSLDRGQVMVISLWDDVEVNMLWLDSAYPLDKDPSEPGVLRGECPGGETSTPTYVRDKYPNGYVIFQSAAIGEIGSTLQKAPTSSPTAAPCDYCSSSPGMNQPECSNKSKADCMNMVNNEGKCAWHECDRNPTKYPTKSPVSSPTKNPTPGTSSSPTKAPDCKSWCASSGTSWDEKCNWAKCSLCSECDSAETDAPTDSPTSPPKTSPPTFDFDDANDDNNGTVDDDEELVAVLAELVQILNVLVNILNSLLGALGTSARIPNF